MVKSVALQPLPTVRTSRVGEFTDGGLMLCLMLLFESYNQLAIALGKVLIFLCLLFLMQKGSEVIFSSLIAVPPDSLTFAFLIQQRDKIAKQ